MASTDRAVVTSTKNKHKDERWSRKKDGCGRKARAMVEEEGRRSPGRATDVYSTLA
jgi:hypothetical protein